MKKIGEFRPFVSIIEAAELLGVSRRRVHQLREESWFPQPIVLGPRSLRWNRDELIEAVRKRGPRVSSMPEPEGPRKAREQAAE